MLDHSDWLADAKRLMVGQSKRIYHGAETRPNLVIRNEPEGWSAYCFHCKQHNFVPKGYIEAVQYKQDLITKLKTVQDTTVPLEQLPEYLQTKILRFLIKKGLWAALASPYLVGVVLEEQRLLFNVGTAWLGRDYTEMREPKWMTYQEGLAYLKGSPVLFLTEDVLSALKVHALTGCSALALQGTQLKQQHILCCLQANAVILAFDADAAGNECTVKTRQRLLNLGCRIYKAELKQDLKLYRDFHGLHIIDSSHAAMGLGQIQQLYQDSDITGRDAHNP